MTVVELFAGAGGASLGLLAAGFTEARAVEWNHDACETRRAAGLRCDEGDVGDPAHYAGVTADALWSSFPCQAWSTAGKRLGKNDPRNGWPATVAAIDLVKPTWFMAENVPGLTFHKGACEGGQCVDDCARLYFEGTIVRDLGERFASVEWRILDAARYGVPQNRERLIIVAGPRPIAWPEETHASPEALRQVGMFPDRRKPWVTVRQALGLGGSIVRESGVGAEREPRTVDEPAYTMRVQHNGGGCGVSVVGIATAHKPGVRIDDRERVDLTDRPAWTVAADVGRNRGGAMQVVEDPKHPHARPDAPAPALRSGGSGHSAPPMWLNQKPTNRGSIPQSRRPMRLDTPADTIQASGEGPRPPCIPDGSWLRTEMTGAVGSPDTNPAPTINRKANTYVHPTNPGTRAASRPELLDRPSPTVTTCEVKGTRGEGQHGGPDRASDAAWLGAGIRRLTPAECAILQSFPPDHPWRGTKTSIYAQIGNAAPPPLVRVVAEAVLAAHTVLARRSA